jgi:hypothetical protein
MCLMENTYLVDVVATDNGFHLIIYDYVIFA